jgi:hypothetical protein
MTNRVKREAFVRATRDLPELRITGIVLPTARRQPIPPRCSCGRAVERPRPS